MTVKTKSKLTLGIGIVFSAAILAGCGLLHAADKLPKRPLLRVGVYDSRAIAIAYGNSEHFSKVLKEKQAELEQAKKEGNTERIKEIEAWGPAQQAEAHLKAFSTAPVHDCFDCVGDQIPQAAKAAGVDIIVSKWEFDYLAEDAETVDVTIALAKLFNPSDHAWKSINSLDKWKPYTPEQIRKLEKEHPGF
jgi:hypothetical protein